MKCPPPGLCHPCKIVKVHDGDTVYVRLYDPIRDQTGLTVHRVRLLDCWCKEVRGEEREEGLKAKRFLEERLATVKELMVWVPLDKGWSFQSITTMGRVLGRLFVDGQDISELMIEAGFAKRTNEEWGA